MRFPQSTIFISTLILTTGLFPTIAAATDNKITEDEAIRYCEQVGGTPALFKFVAIDARGRVNYTGVEQHWCNLHIGVDDQDQTDVHSHVEVKTLANNQLTLAEYAISHPQEFTPPGGGANPAYFYCRQVNGTLPGMLKGYSQVGWVKDGAGLDIYGGCMFADGSTIDEWTLTYAQHYKGFADNVKSRFNHHTN